MDVTIPSPKNVAVLRPRYPPSVVPIGTHHPGPGERRLPDPASLQASGTPAGGGRPPTATQRQPRQGCGHSHSHSHSHSHGRGARVGRTNRGSTRTVRKCPTRPVVNYYCCRSTTPPRRNAEDEMKRREGKFFAHAAFLFT
ncbi:hypothetical protein BAE44_0012707 [Dichanthelium oligosanthes]|uniref:Uncharacterized protein n=1 Tax=Dichanthelium oligosanthes TaxID=888268 RepID=A0A1E5VMH0_9POAL|nr:hypothetical protein BAE44_0012707 [Dichanthelium oligosanthes]